MTAGEKIRQIREEKGMTQDDLALALGLKSRSSVSKVEMAGDNLSTKTVLTYAKALGVPVSDIVTIDDRKRSVSSIEKQLEGFNLEQLQRIESYAHYLQTKIKENKTLMTKQADSDSVFHQNMRKLGLEESEENDEEQESFLYP